MAKEHKKKHVQRPESPPYIGPLNQVLAISCPVSETGRPYEQFFHPTYFFDAIKYYFPRQFKEVTHTLDFAVQNTVPSHDYVAMHRNGVVLHYGYHPWAGYCVGDMDSCIGRESAWIDLTGPSTVTMDRIMEDLGAVSEVFSPKLLSQLKEVNNPKEKGLSDLDANTRHWAGMLAYLPSIMNPEKKI